VTIRLLQGDVLDRLAGLPAESVHCVVTSPPYWGLRDYGVAGQIGLEASPAEYVETMVAVFREVRRVLRSDGTVWLNLGDCYATGAGSAQVPDNKNPNSDIPIYQPNRMPQFGLKPKDIVGIPWRVAFALQADGWWLRQDIIWSKPNPMPESVADRCTKAHEYLFLLSKSERYYYDADAIREASVGTEPGDMDGGPQRLPDGSNANAGRNYRKPNAPCAIKSPHGQGFARRARTAGNKSHKYVDAYEASESEEHRTKAGLMKVADVPFYSRNRRSVWTVATAPFPEAHFATFPPALVEPCIKAGTSDKGVCAACGASWVRTTERLDQGWNGSRYGERALSATGGAKTGGTERSTLGSANGKLTGKTATTGWQPTCGCGAATVPATVLDPFGGSGTTGLVADRLGRDAVLIELNPEYAAMAERRLRADAPLFVQITAECAASARRS
jgi:DNA modification methylase